MAVGASSQHSYWLQFSGQTVKGSTSGRGRDQHQRPWARKLLAPSCRQSRQAEANTMRASSRAYCWRCVAFPLSCSKRAPRPDPDPSLRRIDQTCLASCPASIRVEACGVEKELSFGQQPTESNFWEEPAGSLHSSRFPTQNHASRKSYPFGACGSVKNLGRAAGCICLCCAAPADHRRSIAGWPCRRGTEEPSSDRHGSGTGEGDGTRRPGMIA